MKLKKIIAVLTAIACLVCLASCEKDSASSVSVGENGVGELITPDKDSEEYDLGTYRIDRNGIKLYYDDADIPAELMLALENYFLSFQNGDLDAYKNSLFPDYAERYDKYLRENYSDSSENNGEYTLQNSFEAQRGNLESRMLSEIYADSESEKNKGYSGKFEITRIRGERPSLTEGETEESRVKDFFSYLDDIFDMDYYNFVAENSDGFERLTFFIFAKGEDGEEHRIISETEIVFAKKDGKYYTFG